MSSGLRNRSFSLVASLYRFAELIPIYDPLDRKLGTNFHILFIRLLTIKIRYLLQSDLSPTSSFFLHNIPLIHQFADSFLFSPHKTMLTTMSCCCLWMKDRKWSESALTTDAGYLTPEKDTSFDLIVRIIIGWYSRKVTNFSQRITLEC